MRFSIRSPFNFSPGNQIHPFDLYRARTQFADWFQLALGAVRQTNRHHSTKQVNTDPNTKKYQSFSKYSKRIIGIIPDCTASSDICKCTNSYSHTKESMLYFCEGFRCVGCVAPPPQVEPSPDSERRFIRLHFNQQLIEPWNTGAGVAQTIL